MGRSIPILIFMLSALPIFSQDKVGTTAAPFLGIGAGVRAIGMGGAFTAVATDPSALYWNPAGISRNGKTEVLLQRTNYLLGTKYNYFAGVLALDENNAVGLSVTNLAYGEDWVTSVEYPDGTGEKWGASDWALDLTYSRNLSDRFSIAGTGRMVIQRIWRESATGWVLSAGLLYITPFNDLKIGMSIANFGTDMQLAGEDLFVTYDPDPSIKGNNKKIPAELNTNSYPLPLLFRIGLAMDVVSSDEGRITLAADALHPSDNAQSVNVGAEFSWNKMLFARVGYRSMFLTDSQGGLTVGGGLSYDVSSRFRLEFDYAYQDYGLLNNVQNFAVSIGF
jgi:opacity protein-like surface antigen